MKGYVTHKLPIIITTAGVNRFEGGAQDILHVNARSSRRISRNISSPFTVVPELNKSIFLSIAISRAGVNIAVRKKGAHLDMRKFTNLLSKIYNMDYVDLAISKISVRLGKAC